MNEGVRNIIMSFAMLSFFIFVITGFYFISNNNTQAYTCTPKVIEVEHTEVRYAPCVCPDIKNDCYDEVLDRIDGVNAFKSQIEVRK